MRQAKSHFGTALAFNFTPTARKLLSDCTRRLVMKRMMAMLSGAALGAAGMYFLDPEHGSRRRRAIRRTMHDFSKQAAGGVNDMLRRSGGGQAIDLHQTYEIAAPLPRVFEFFTDPENYGRVSCAVTDVHVYGGGRFAKDIAVAGIPLHFEERFVECVPGEMLASRSEPRSALQFSKQLRFKELDSNRTRLHLSFRYFPPGGAIGHAVARLLSIDPATVLRDILQRAKAYLEQGGASSHGAWPAAREAERLAGPGVPIQHVGPAFSQPERDDSPWPPSPEDPLHTSQAAPVAII
jgi:uncharacterized membrane protein